MGDDSNTATACRGIGSEAGFAWSPVPQTGWLQVSLMALKDTPGIADNPLFLPYPGGIISWTGVTLSLASGCTPEEMQTKS